MSQKMVCKELNDALKGVKLHSQGQITPIVGSFDLFKEVILDIGDYTLNESWHDSFLNFWHFEKKSYFLRIYYQKS